MISLFSYSKDPVKQWGQLQVKGNQLCSQTGDPIVLRGVSYGWHNLWPRFYNKQSVKWLKKDWKCTVLRAAMGTVIEDNYIENPEFALKCMNKVIKAAIKNDLYIIIDWHTYYPQKKEAKAFFSMMAQKYGKYPHIIYEIYNEPMEDSWESVKEYAADIISEIRKGEFYQFNLSSCIRQQNSLTAQFVSFSLANLANIFYPPIFTIINLCLL